ncbi:MAG: response regulator [Bacteroidetes bacterium]|nr:response regulator [Bacteroidota bacterium]MBS1974225.1 response regulator [Bacteroidota bacterium]
MDLNKSPKIFVVEDSPFYQSMILKILEPISNDIHAYSKGEDCLKELDQNPAIVIMDYRLEGNINGLDTIQRIRNSNTSAFVILFSAEPELKEKENFSSYGAFEYLEKSVDTFPLLKQIIRSHSSGAAY